MRPFGFILTFLCATAVAAQRTTAVADGETYHGATVGGGVTAFRGVPYAEPPIGDRRWTPPVPRPAKHGDRDATSFGASCMQTDRLVTWARNIAIGLGTADRFDPEPPRPSEDCLYLNVWSANVGGRDSRPVMVWFHGGSNQAGEGHARLYDGAALARRGVVVVKINYRLGMFGFLAHPALTAESPHHASGNYGLLDQIEALKWVQRNIRAFGGDPSRVTVFGESAGAIDITHLLASPAATGLFHRAIVESGAAMGAVQPLKDAERAGASALASLVTDTAHVAASLRAVPAQAILDAGVKAAAGRVVAADVTIDGWVLPDLTARVFEEGHQQRVPLLIGTNALEMTALTAYMPPMPQTVAAYETTMRLLLGPAAPTALKLYPASSVDEAQRRSYEVITHLIGTCPTRMAARAVAATGQPTYLYQFTRVLPGGEKLGAFHSMEIGYVFGNAVRWMPRDSVDDSLSEAMIGYWTRFAATGDPNGAGAVSWPRYDSDQQYLELGAVVRQGRNLEGDLCDAVEPRIRATWPPR
ncbi:MAG: carboxylesterase family protein [Gemmatimonadaceae bacterium]